MWIGDLKFERKNKKTEKKPALDISAQRQILFALMPNRVRCCSLLLSNVYLSKVYLMSRDTISQPGHTVLVTKKERNTVFQ